MVTKRSEKAHPNLLLHEKDFPNEEALLSLIKRGLPKYDMEGVGNGMSSEGSGWIIKELEKADERPLWISIWGGVPVKIIRPAIRLIALPLYVCTQDSQLRNA